MKIIKFIISFIFVPTILAAQGNFISNGEQGISLGCGDLRNSDFTSISGAAIVSLWGRLDIGLSYGNLTYHNGIDGNGASVLLSYYFLRAEKSRIYMSFNYVYTKDNLKEMQSYWSNSLQSTLYTQIEMSSIANSYGISIGMLPPHTNILSFMVSVNIAMIYPAGDPNTNPYGMLGTDLSLLIPVFDSSRIIPTFEYDFINGTHNFGLGVNYLYKFKF